MKKFKELFEGEQFLPKDPDTLRRLRQTDHAHSVNYFNRLVIPKGEIHRSLRGDASMALLLTGITRYSRMAPRIVPPNSQTGQLMKDIGTVKDVIYDNILNHPILRRKISQLPTFQGKTEEDIDDHIGKLIRSHEAQVHKEIDNTLSENPKATIIPPFGATQNLRDHFLDFINSHGTGK